MQITNNFQTNSITNDLVAAKPAAKACARRQRAGSGADFQPGVATGERSFENQPVAGVLPGGHVQRVAVADRE